MTVSIYPQSQLSLTFSEAIPSFSETVAGDDLVLLFTGNFSILFQHVRRTFETQCVMCVLCAGGIVRSMCQ